MSIQTLNLTPALYNYLKMVSLREPEVLTKLRLETARLPGATMQISPEQGQFMGLLVELLNAKKTLDIGTFTGYSALIVALHLPVNGKVIAFDVNKESTDIAKRYWTEAQVISKIDLRLGEARDHLQQLLDAGGANTFDFAFIDADKRNYLTYYELAFELIRPGGLIAIDNVLWDGKVADPENQEVSTLAIREVNNRLFKDERVTLSLLPIGDGLTLARKR